jgi:hypothetical protein
MYFYRQFSQTRSISPFDLHSFIWFEISIERMLRSLITPRSCMCFMCGKVTINSSSYLLCILREYRWSSRSGRNLSTFCLSCWWYYYQRVEERTLRSIWITSSFSSLLVLHTWPSNLCSSDRGCFSYCFQFLCSRARTLGWRYLKNHLMTL